MIGALKVFKNTAEQILIGIAAGHAEDNTAHAQPYMGADLQEFQPDALAGCLRHARSPKPDAAKLVENHIGQRGEPQA